MGKRLYVGNLSFNATEMDLRDLFADSGTVAEAKLVMDRDTGRPRGFGFVEMSTDAEAAQLPKPRRNVSGGGILRPRRPVVKEKTSKQENRPRPLVRGT